MLLANLQASLNRPRVQVPANPDLPAVPEFSEGFITSLVTGYDKVPQRHRDNDTMVHVSELREFCPRRTVLIERDGIANLKSPRSQDQVMWALGHAAEKHVRTQVIRALNFRSVIGQWSCKCSGLLYSGYHEPARLCPRCHGPADDYGEVDLIDSESGIEGHADLLLLVRRFVIPVEIKSKNKTDFDALTKPDPDHIFQVGAYRRLLQAGGFHVAPVGIIFYVCKDYSFKGSPYREFHTNLTDQEWLTNILELKWRSARSLIAARTSPHLPPRLPCCDSQAAMTAKKCVACVSCFSREV